MKIRLQLWAMLTVVGTSLLSFSCSELVHDDPESTIAGWEAESSSSSVQQSSSSVDSTILVDPRDGKEYQTVTIGTQVWMAENLNFARDSGSWCYGNDPARCEAYGRLYDWRTAFSVCPEGWHLPTDGEWQILEVFLGMGAATANTFGWRGSDQGTQLKSASGWEGKDQGTDVSGFSALPGGGYEDGKFDMLGTLGAWWTSMPDGANAWCRAVSGDSTNIYRIACNQTYAYSVRCLKGKMPELVSSSSQAPSSSSSLSDPVLQDPYWNTSVPYGTLLDSRDGQSYRTVVIGTQTWMAQNLNFATDSGSWCNDNLKANCTVYGRLYDWATAMKLESKYNFILWKGSDSLHQGLCPDGWHLPNDVEWQILERALGMSNSQLSATGWRGNNQGTLLKTTSGWTNEGNGTDQYGFSALPGGYLEDDSLFGAIGNYGNWKSATEYADNRAWERLVGYDTAGITRSNYGKATGASVRCVLGARAVSSSSSVVPSSSSVVIVSSSSVTVSSSSMIPSSSSIVPSSSSLAPSSSSVVPSSSSVKPSSSSVAPSSSSVVPSSSSVVVPSSSSAPPSSSSVVPSSSSVVPSSSSVVPSSSSVVVPSSSSAPPSSSSVVPSSSSSVVVTAPTASPSGGTYAPDQQITLSTTTLGAQIRYTLDGSIPTASSTLYTGPFPLDHSATVVAKAFVGNSVSAGMAVATFTLVVNAPTITPAQGDYGEGQTVIISTTTKNVQIYYTLDGSTPTTGSFLYDSPLSLDTNATVKAFAVRDGCTASSVANAAYRFVIPAPDLYPKGGTYSGTQMVFMTTTMPEAEIRYTTDGSEPTLASTLYTGAVSVSSSIALKAKTFRTGWVGTITTERYDLGSMEDARDDNVYRTVTIGSQIWMAENLAYLPSVNYTSQSSTATAYYYVYGYDGTNVASAKVISTYTTYGVLYNYPAALTACPSGWHLPSSAEWQTLVDYVGGSAIAGQKLKSTSGWTSYSGITNEDAYGFSALPGGGYFGSDFDVSGLYGNWWTSTPNGSSGAYRRYMGYSYAYVYSDVSGRVYGFSVRCVQN